MEKQETFEGLSSLEKFIIRRTHPASIVLMTLSFLWIGYFLWIRQWILGLAFFSVFMGTGEVIARIDKQFHRSLKNGLNGFQKLLLYHVVKPNLVFHVLACAVYLLACWNQSVFFLLTAITLVGVGYISPWFGHRRETYYTALKINGDE
jgi:hypothetical protein